jgi:hypothetical protein
MQRKPNNKQLDSKRQIFGRVITAVISLIIVCICILAINLPTPQLQFFGIHFGGAVAVAQNACSSERVVLIRGNNNFIACAGSGTELEINPNPINKQTYKVDKIFLTNGSVDSRCVQRKQDNGNGNGNIYTVKPGKPCP